MQVRTPITVITGSLGSGKTTLLRHILESATEKIAILMNEFGEIAIDSQIVEGKNVRIAELGGGCVCCSLLGEFEAAVNELIDFVNPDRIVLETTGVAEPDSLIFDIQESLPRVRLDGVVTVLDADATVQYPQIGHTTRMQIEAADTILINKIDLVSEAQLAEVESKAHRMNPQAATVHTQRCRMDPDLIFGIGRPREIVSPQHIHQPEFDSFSFTSEAPLDRSCFEDFVEGLASDVYRAKGFVRFSEGTFLFNFVAGRWDLEPFPHERTVLVFIGRDIASKKEEMRSNLKQCLIAFSKISPPQT